MMYIPWFIIVIRLLVPIFILRFPLLGILASMQADGADWNIISVTSNEMRVVYQNWDKAMDSYSFIFIVWVVCHWQDAWARRVALGFFIYRMIGTVLFWSTGWEPLLFLFPNVFENFVILCLILFWMFKKKKLNFDSLHKAILLGVLIIPKMIHEYLQHFLGHQPWEIYNFGKWLGFRGTAESNVNLLLWIGVLYILPMGGFLLYVRGKHSLSRRKRSF